MTNGKRWSCLALTSFFLVACGEGGTSWAGTMTDSAGVTLVANPPEGLWAPGEEWTVTEEYRIGGMDAPTESQFGQVAGIDVDQQGNVYVLDAQASEVKVFGPDGGLLRTMGRQGSGPGEMARQVVGLFVTGNEIRVPDILNARVARFTLDGEPLAPTPLDIAKGVPIRWDELQGGRIVAQFRSISGLTTDEAPTGDPIVSVGEDVPDTLAVLPPGESIRLSQGGAQFRFFEPEPLWDAGDDGLLITARNSAYRIEVRDASGTLVRVIEKAHEPKPVTDGDKQRMLDAIRKAMADQGLPAAAVQQVLQGAEFADRYPAMAQILVGPESTVWVEGLHTAQELADAGNFDLQDIGSQEWEVFDAEGRYLGVVTLPPKFMPMRVDGDAFWGIQRDELDVQSVVRYRIVQPEAS
jgi:hypothetical protein